jgi:hypothetical protein
MTARAQPDRMIHPVPPEAWILWTLSALFLLRVLGQVLVEFLHVRFLPPSPEWFSGLLPYPLLLPVQIAILVLMARINGRVTLRQGFFTRAHPRLGRVLLIGSIVYVAVMVARYFISGHAHPERRFWPPGSIPIVFHFVLAAYLYVLSRLARFPVSPRPGSQAPELQNKLHETSI